MKHLSQFFKILTNLWVHEDFVEHFDEYISRLNPIIQEVISIDLSQASNLGSIKQQLMKLFYILKGIAHGLTSSKNFSLFFDWFYPEYFSIIGKALTAFIQEDDLALLIFKFIAEMVNNRCSRLRFDTWNINGLIIFKEAARISIEYLTFTDNLNNKLVKSDLYKDKYKFLQVFMSIFYNCITGYFINFAVCEYYNDDTFTVFSEGILRTIVS